MHTVYTRICPFHGQNLSFLHVDNELLIYYTWSRYIHLVSVLWSAGFGLEAQKLAVWLQDEVALTPVLDVFTYNIKQILIYEKEINLAL